MPDFATSLLKPPYRVCVLRTTCPTPVVTLEHPGPSPTSGPSPGSLRTGLNALPSLVGPAPPHLLGLTSCQLRDAAGSSDRCPSRHPPQLFPFMLVLGIGPSVSFFVFFPSPLLRRKLPAGRLHVRALRHRPLRCGRRMHLGGRLLAQRLGGPEPTAAARTTKLEGCRLHEPVLHALALPTVLGALTHWASPALPCVPRPPRPSPTLRSVSSAPLVRSGHWDSEKWGRWPRVTRQGDRRAGAGAGLRPGHHRPHTGPSVRPHT